MCCKRKIEEAQYGSTIEYEGRLWVVLGAELTEEVDDVLLGLREGEYRLTLPFGTQVLSHSLGPVERRRFGNPKCELPLIEVNLKGE